MILSYANILSESRKYGLCLFLTHQYIEQLQEEIRTAIFGNVGTLISFRVGAIDADYLEKEFFPVSNKEDIISLSQYLMYLKLMIDGATSKPFSTMTLPPKINSPSLKEKLFNFHKKDMGEKDLLLRKVYLKGIPGRFRKITSKDYLIKFYRLIQIISFSQKIISNTGIN